MKNVLLISLLPLMLLTSACSTKVIRRSGNDPMMRVMIDPSIKAEHYVQIKAALVESGKFEVIDRRDGFQAAIREQDLQFRSGYQNRFSDQEKWAHIGRMYGAMGIITADAQCFQRVNWMGTYVRTCKQFLTFVNGVTGKIEFSVRGQNEEQWTADFTVPDWDDVVEKAVSTYPKYFQPRHIEKQLQQYMDQSEELSKREQARQEKQAPVPQSDLQRDFQKMRDIANMQNEE